MLRTVRNERKKLLRKRHLQRKNCLHFTL